MRLAQRLLIGIMSGIVVNQVIEFRIPQRQNAMGSHKFPEIGNVFVCRINCSEFTASIRMKAESLHIVEPAKLDAFSIQGEEDEALKSLDKQNPVILASDCTLRIAELAIFRYST